MTLAAQYGQKTVARICTPPPPAQTFPCTKFKLTFSVLEADFVASGSLRHLEREADVGVVTDIDG